MDIMETMLRADGQLDRRKFLLLLSAGSASVAFGMSGCSKKSPTAPSSSSHDWVSSSLVSGGPCLDGESASVELSIDHVPTEFHLDESFEARASFHCVEPGNLVQIWLEDPRGNWVNGSSWEVGVDESGGGWMFLDVNLSSLGAWKLTARILGFRETSIIMNVEA